MASAFYTAAKAALLGGSIDMDTDTIKVTLVDTADYTFSAAHDFYDDVPVGARVATGELLSKTISGNVFDAADLVLPSVTGDSCEALIIWKDTGVEGTSNLIAYIDGFTVTPGGGNITITWSSGANKIFAL